MHKLLVLDRNTWYPITAQILSSFFFSFFQLPKNVRVIILDYRKWFHIQINMGTGSQITILDTMHILYLDQNQHQPLQHNNSIFHSYMFWKNLSFTIFRHNLHNKHEVCKYSLTFLLDKLDSLWNILNWVYAFSFYTLCR